MSFLKKSAIGSVRRARLEAYLAAGVGAVGLAASSEAGVVIIDLTGKTGDNMGISPGPGAFPAGFQSFSDIVPRATVFGWNNYNGNFGISVQTPGGGLAVTGYSPYSTPVIFGSGALINSSSGVFDGNYLASAFKSNYRTVADVGPNSYLGFLTTAGQFGYFEVLWTSSTNTFRLVSGAYESNPGDSIQTPAGFSAVPEPSSMAVVALLVGGTALRQWRKKRRDQVATSDESLAS
jgi:hypothetical protein